MKDCWLKVLSLKCYYDQKISSIFSSDFESMIAQHLTGKILGFDFIQRLFTLSVSFGFHGLPLLTFQTERLDLRGLDLAKSDVIYSLA